MFNGIYYYTIDDKNRLFIPSKLRKNIKQFIITPGMDNCIYAYPMAAWNKINDKFDRLNLKDKSHQRAFKRAFLSNAIDAEVDTQGRIVIPVPLKAQIKIKKDIVIIGVGDRLEIWAKDNWIKYYKQAQKVVTKVSSQLEL